jgi:hypothetical protein
VYLEARDGFFEDRAELIQGDAAAMFLDEATANRMAEKYFLAMGREVLHKFVPLQFFNQKNN